jgi:tetratricopeptide (TPR) repeat protein
VTGLALLALLAGAAAGAGPFQGASPFQVEHARSREARERIAGSDPSAALPAYEALEKELGDRPEIEAGRGAALERLGRHPAAEAAFGKARKAPEPLGSRALLGLGNARAGKGDAAGAATAYREALARDPAYADARHNLEVVLRRQAEGAPRPDPARPPQPSQGGPKDQGAGGDKQEERSGGPQGPKPAGAPTPGQEPRPRPAPGGGDERKEAGEGGTASDGRLSREEAERLLDALRSREKNLPSRARPRGEGRRDAQRDW